MMQHDKGPLLFPAWPPRPGPGAALRAADAQRAGDAATLVRQPRPVGPVAPPGPGPAGRAPARVGPDGHHRRAPADRAPVGHRGARRAGGARAGAPGARPHRPACRARRAHRAGRSLLVEVDEARDGESAAYLSVLSERDRRSWPACCASSTLTGPRPPPRVGPWNPSTPPSSGSPARCSPPRASRSRMTGTEHVPRHGGAVMAINHTGYFDFTYAGLVGVKVGRYVRFMAKKSIWSNPVAGPLMKGMQHIPVDREAGLGSFDAARDALRAVRSSASSPRRPSPGPSSSRRSSPAPCGWRRRPACRSCRSRSGVRSGSGPRASPRKMGRHGIPLLITVGAPIEVGADENAVPGHGSGAGRHGRPAARRPGPLPGLAGRRAAPAADPARRHRADARGGRRDGRGRPAAGAPRVLSAALPRSGLVVLALCGPCRDPWPGPWPCPCVVAVAPCRDLVRLAVWPWPCPCRGPCRGLGLAALAVTLAVAFALAVALGLWPCRLAWRPCPCRWPWAAWP